MKTTQLTLYIVDDNEALRGSIVMLLFSRGFAVQCFESGEAFLQSVAMRQPGCVILDLSMSGMNGLEVLKHLRLHNSPLVTLFLSGNGDIPTALEAVRQGAYDWVVKPDVQQLLDILPSAMENALQRLSALTSWETLTPKEREVARLVGLGQPNKEIARQVIPPCSPRSIETHRASIFNKLMVANDNELGRWLKIHHWLPL